MTTTTNLPGPLAAGRLSAQGATVAEADLTGAQRTATEAVAAVLHRARAGHGSLREIAPFDAAETMAAPLRHGLSGPLGALGGTHPAYRIEATAERDSSRARHSNPASSPDRPSCSA